MRQEPNNAGPDVGFGSGFLLESGIVAPKAHVVATCTEKTLIGISTANIRVRFSRVISDKVRDLALLVPAEKLTVGFRLAPQTARSRVQLCQHGATRSPTTQPHLCGV